ncbi:hypothetical protein, partial [Bradyrhizobium uaiense]|uniref:hypothetical protein n=1 Tax=Bradyrhizobium uaiense TaxID=2594946 RepID=UPI0019D5E408
RLSIPMTRRFRHSGSWSFLKDAWSGLARLRSNTINLRDDRLNQQAASERATTSAVASERLASSSPARYPI